MNLKSFFKKLFFGDEVLEKVDSPINGEITVVENLFGGREMKIGGLAQSGGLVERLWGTGVKAIRNTPACKRLAMSGRQHATRTCLILGLGCGTVAKLISDRFPMAKIVGVEIDPMVVELGKKYFGLNEIPNLEIEITDAISMVHSSKFMIQSYDLIIVDLYLGQDFPKEAEEEKFLQGSKMILADGGRIIFNRLYYNQEHRKKAEEFLIKVRKIFPEVCTKKAVTNLLIFCQNSSH